MTVSLDQTSAAGVPGLRRPTCDGETLLPFNIIDEAVHLLDSDAAPWSIQFELAFEGRLDGARLRQALHAALLRHPLARARKKPSRRSAHTDSWIIADSVDVDPLQVVDCPDEVAVGQLRERLQGFAVPLGESPPLRARLVHRPAGDLLMLNVNHAAMDAFGVLRLVQSIARAYTGDADHGAEIDGTQARDLPRRLAAATLAVKVRRQLVLAEKVRDLVAPPARVAPEGAADEAGYGFRLEQLDEPQTRALRDLDHPGTLNDILVAALHITIAGWNEAHRARCGRIGVLVPVNLRPEAWRRDVVGNFSLPARIATTRRARQRPGGALRSVTTQTMRKKKVGMGTALIEVLGQSRVLPLWAKQTLVMLLPVTGNRLVDTAMLSNLGVIEPPSFGPEAGAVRDVWFSPPARMPLGLAIGVATVGGRLFLSFRYRHRLWSDEAARRFVARFVDALAGVAG